MPLALQSGEFTPHIRWMAQEAVWKMSTESGAVNFDFGMAIIDLANIKTGWGFFAEGQAPEWVWDEDISHPKPRPDHQKEWKRGFCVDLFSEKMFGEDSVREFAATATGANMAIDNLYKQYEAEAPANAGKVPVVKYEGVVRQKVGKGNTAIPTLKIVKWVERPAELQQGSAAAPKPAPQAAPASDDTEF